MQQIVKMVVQPSPVILPAGAVKRTPPRPENQRQPNYETLFDDSTLFYDVFDLGGSMNLVGPPLLNLEELVTAGDFTGSAGQRYEADHLKLDRTSVVTLTSESGSGGEPIFMQSGGFSVSVPASKNYLHLFESRNVLVTKSKNNKLSWISDWVKFHVAEQGIDAVLIYDNASTEYGPADVLEAISQSGIKTAVVVHWPFKFGPQGGSWSGLKNAPWDSDFCEYGIMEHARRRFLERAAGVLNADIDELVMTDGENTVFQTLRDLKCGAISFTGRWIETAGRQGSSESYSDYSHFDTRRAPTTAKWAISPRDIPEATQWKTHMVAGIRMEKVTTTRQRHFMGISSDWKWQRSAVHAITEHHQVDRELRRALDAVFPSGSE